MKIDHLLQDMIKAGGSDVHLKVGMPPGIRVAGKIYPRGEDRLRPEHTLAAARELLDNEQWERFERLGDMDCSYSLSGVGRFRVNVMRQRGSISLVLRHIPDKIPSIDELGLPPICKSLATKPRGLVLVTGPTGSGKSTTLAAMIDLINSTVPGHILTMEDPVEFLHRDKKCYINQREVGTDTVGFNEALRRALRQDPDVILIGEMRDLETISLAVTAAETGHLVLATLHTTSAMKSIDRIVSVFPSEQQTQIRLQMAGTLQGIISQTLIPSIKGGRAAAIEVLVANDAVRTLIRENKMAQIPTAMQTGKKIGMQTLEESLSVLVAKKIISYEHAIAKANYPEAVTQPYGSPSPAGIR
ncbi:MAG: type IV pilus twitching motility protein PilT [Gemmatimonadota bacterium]|nr:type IV pilus twitching motility protein PilT [Gemmatimonadota bacterium]